MCKEMEKKRHEDLAEIHLGNLRKESHTIISNQLSKTVLIDSEKEILAKEQCIIKKTLNGAYRLDKIPNKKIIYHAYSGCYSETLTKAIKDNRLMSTILAQYFDGSIYYLSAEVFWINQGGMAIPPHQDRSYSSEKQLSIIVPLSLNINSKYAMSYSGVEEGTTLDHNLSISNMVYYAKSIQQYVFSVNYKPTDIILHTQYSMHKSRSMPRDGKRITYARYLAKRNN
ncbi:hypothetical protein [Synechococcus sp. MU1625]|uniref:hypothetical protein n=1 Tax=Synechococcus sp. MU1625 TaxID=2508347 RepID=UPI001CF86DCA|nr:hypothetical protein [Synechococcus sp. MU1625]MCB4398417.1 hypothetical protein [Synechococcus sp. MU1625]